MVVRISVDNRNGICLKVNNLKYYFVEYILLWYSFGGGGGGGWGRLDFDYLAVAVGIPEIKRY